MNHTRNEWSNETGWWNSTKIFSTSHYCETISEKERGLYSLPLWSEGLSTPLFSEKTCNEIENWLTITAPLVALIVTQGTSLPKVAEIKEATKITTQRKMKPLTNKSSKIEVNLDPDTGCYLQSKIQW